MTQARKNTALVIICMLILSLLAGCSQGAQPQQAEQDAEKLKILISQQTFGTCSSSNLANRRSRTNFGQILEEELGKPLLL